MTILSTIALYSICFTLETLHAGSGAKVTEEDKKAAAAVSQTQENEKAKETKENKDNTESQTADTGTKEEQPSAATSETDKTSNKEIDSHSNEDLEEETLDFPVPEPKNGDWYSQELSEESKTLLKDFELLVADVATYATTSKSEADTTQYSRKTANTFFVNHFGDAEEVKTVEDVTVKSNDGTNYEIPVRIYHVTDGISNNLLVYVHGGGWSQGSADTHGYICRKLAKILQMDVASVDYRLAPENAYPTPLNDVLSVYKYYATESKYENIVISGDSAGGNLCAALCIKINDEGLKLPYAQILLYPPLSNDFNSKSYEAFGKCLALTKTRTMAFIKNYTGKECGDGTVVSNKYVYPLLEDNMEVFPKTMIISSGYDVLLDGQLQFAEKLRQNDIPVLHEINEGVVHGFMTYGNPYESLVTENCKKIKAFLEKIEQNKNEASKEVKTAKKVDESKSEEKTDEKA